MNHIAPLHEPLIREVPLSRLALAPENVRKTPADPIAEAEMKASIATHGLLENLVVRMDGPADAGAYAVIAGGRRLAAMKALGRGGHDRRRPSGALPGRRRSGDGGRAVAGGEYRPHRHASRRSGDRVLEAGRRRPLRGFHRGAFRHVRAPGRTAPAPRQRRAGPARRLPRPRDRPGSAEGLLRHARPCPPDGGLGTGRGPGLPARARGR